MKAAARRRATGRSVSNESNARRRLLGAAYKLFSERGVNQTGIDTILKKSGCAKASLYNNFNSKTDLVIAFLDQRDQVWTRDWIGNEIRRRAKTPEKRMLAVFDVFDDWFRKRNFEGCSFINVLLESEHGSPVRRAAASHLTKIRMLVVKMAKDARLQYPEQFAHAWHMLMKGSIVSASEGVKDAAQHAKRAGEIMLAGWPRC